MAAHAAETPLFAWLCRDALSTMALRQGHTRIQANAGTGTGSRVTVEV